MGLDFKFAMKTLSGGRIGIAAQALGIASGAYELALAYSKQRKAFGTEICNHQAIAFKQADMATDIEAARHMVMKAAWEKDQGIALRIHQVLWPNYLLQKLPWNIPWKQFKFMAVMAL